MHVHADILEVYRIALRALQTKIKQIDEILLDNLILHNIITISAIKLMRKPENY